MTVPLHQAHARLTRGPHPRPLPIEEMGRGELLFFPLANEGLGRVEHAPSTRVVLAFHVEDGFHFGEVAVELVAVGFPFLGCLFGDGI
jgi:hypothetical protein